jgi:endonuclease-3
LPRESITARRERTAEIVARLAETYPDSQCSLYHRSPFELLVATVLSAQCTDARVNQVTPALFERYPTPASLAEAPLAEVEEAIRSVNFFRTKAKALVGLARTLVDEHGGEVPREMDALVRLPGVGRKTANVVRGTAFGESDGVVVDTHVRRVAGRLGLTTSGDPEQIERDLLKLLPPAERVAFTHRIIDHGRAICLARTPRCEICPLSDLCPFGRRVLGLDRRPPSDDRRLTTDRTEP